ncbi:MAG: cysteine desulfurase [Victivallaceae bacterium]|nr:cysteine desulfurase [Victivallaceae bacterium]
MKHIYLDYNSTAPVRAEAIAVMMDCCQNICGNPSSMHHFGQQAKQAVDRARFQVARLLNAPPSQVIFTSGGTESNNMAIRGIAARSRGKKQLITCRSEHSSVLNVFKELAKDGFAITYIPVDANGLLDLNALDEALDDTTALVSIMLANNETGVIQPIKEIVEIVHAKGALLHVDAVQALGKMAVDVMDLGADLLSISGHKIGAPKGVGALYVRIGCKIEPLIFGGNQESRLRSGTENVPGIVAFGKVCEFVADNLDSEIAQLRQLGELLEQAILENIPSAVISGAGALRIPNTVNVSFSGHESDTLMMMLDMKGVAVSSGASCSTGSGEPSHVLKSMGLSQELLYSALRLSIGTNNTTEEIIQAVDILRQVVSG